CYDSYAPEIGIAICFSCNKLIYIGQRTKNIRNYNHIGIEKYWATHCTGNSFCSVSYDEYLQGVEQKAIYGYNYDNEYVLYRYELWESNAIKKIQHASEVGKKIKACTIIQRKFIEYYYRSDGLCASELAQHYKILWAVREEMQQN
ncbi:42043_t:CDS:1, partial [Gigaspora margarita]